MKQHSSDVTKTQSVQKQHIRGLPSSNRFKIFVGGLSPKTSERDLLKYFSNIGTAREAKIIRDPNRNENSKGYGFVTFSSIACVENACKLRDIIIDGRKVRVFY